MSKYKPPIPKKMDLYTTESPYLTCQQWQPFIQDRIRAFKKALRDNGSDQRLGMTDAMVKRRTETLLDSIAFIQKRYLCSLLKDYSADIYAVRVPERIKYKKERKYQLVYSTGQLDSDNAGRIVESAVKLTTGEIKMYAEEWERLKQENAPLRTVIAGKIVSVSEFFYDTTIWRYIPTEPKAEERVFREALSAMPYIQQGWLTLRIQKMIDNGHIEVVKDNKNPAKRLIRKRPAGDDTSTSFTSKKKLDSSSFLQNGA